MYLLFLQLEVCSFNHLHPVPPHSTPFSGNQKSGLFHVRFFVFCFFSVFFFLNYNWGFSDGLVGKNPPAMQETQEMGVRSLSQENPLEEKMRTHSSVLAWRIPWTEEPGGLQCTGS